MSKPSLRDRLENFVDEVEWAQQRFNGDDFTSRLFGGMTRELASQIPSMDFGDERLTYKGTTLLCLGQIPYDQVTIGAATCVRAAYLGSDGKIYIEGPRKRLGATVIDIHPYSLEDAMGTWHGISKAQLVDMLTTYFI